MSDKHKKHHLGKSFLHLLVGAGLFLAGAILVWLTFLKIPDFQSFEDRKIINSTKIYDRTGEILLYDIHQNIKRTSVPFDSMSENIKKATIAIEDAEFYNHSGVRVTSTIRAVLSNIFNIGIGGGGSTITQQLVKNSLLTQNKSITRKIKEWVLAIKLDKSMPKDKILEYYLNENPYGGSVYGIEEAAKTYFNKKALDLSLAESAYLAAIPQAPTLLSPYGNNKNRLEERKNLVLSRMKTLGFITEEEFLNAKNEVVVFAPQSKIGIKAPHFVFFIRDYLERKYGPETVENGGLKVITTLDYTLQEKAETIAKEGALENEKNWNGENTGLVAIDPKTGQILTMVGSRDYFDKEIDGNFNIATALRQPGSAFKPFIYATAFNKGFTPDTVLFDLPTEFNSSCSPYGKAKPGNSQDNCYMPDNYDNKTVGPIKLRDALGQSRNIPAVKLFYLAGLNDSLRTSESLGITTLTDISRYGLTLVIGGGEVNLLDITSAYGVFANEGVRNPYTGILKIENKEGQVLEEFNLNSKEVLPRNTALLLSDVLSDDVARAPTFGSSSILKIPGRDVAVKTGTTNSNKDAWTIGYSPNLVVGVWAGNNDNTPMKKGGVSVAGPIWNKFITQALSTLPNERFEKPVIDVDPIKTKPVIRGIWQGGENFFIDTISGKLATPLTPKETMKEKVITNVHSILYWVDKRDILGAPPENPYQDAQFNNWEIPVRDWWAKNGWKYPQTSITEKPFEYDDVHTESSRPQINIVEPNTNTIYKRNQRIYLEINNSSYNPIIKADIFINNTFLDTTKNIFNFSFVPEEIENIQSENSLRVVLYDSVYNSNEQTITFFVE